MDGWMMPWGLSCHSTISVPLSFETNPTSVGLRVHSLTQSLVHTTTRLLPFNSLLKATIPQMRILHVGANQIKKNTLFFMIGDVSHTA